ncbi:PREDICTED: nucleolar and spindle-associated protein 1-A-like [Acropora digitifera]|uniref:nucleolar and spindle-associated protein 1-A-like n=1 Tax=Acropora digitifera TaxID=70779 RepID=UPI00077A189A|nr:PREDICTED: nucleolar and spindle-associated protein 1-A-like [Acropora digitifera]
MIKGKSVEMEVTFEVNELEKMKRPELQQLCKTFGIKANMKNSLLIEALKEQAAQFSSKRKRSLSAKTSPLVKASTATTEETDDQEMTQDDDDDNETFKRQLLDQLEKKVEEKMPVDCKIPRFVQFAKNLKSTKDDDHNKTPGNKWSKIHKVQFEKMDSIDVYLEKKRKRREFFNQSAKRAKVKKCVCQM